jgi:hypothetical protein
MTDLTAPRGPFLGVSGRAFPQAAVLSRRDSPPQCGLHPVHEKPDTT